ncbi:MAG: hypothetical protein E7163_02575 [Firmicutes bacterium]|nr:hypothetical protein [Bacillota bacterium]
MKIILDPESGFLTEDKKKYDVRKALLNAGVKAGVCFKPGEVTPEVVRETETEEQRLKRGLDTIFSEHTSPSEQPQVSLEIVGIPKIMCMVLNNEQQYNADERSLRYTAVKPNDYISEEETTLYNKWLEIFINLLNKEYLDFFKRFNQGDTEEKTNKKTQSAIKKIAQENARYMVSVFMPTTLTYTVPFAQINKICLYMERIINKPLNEFEELLVPYFKEFIHSLKDLDVALTNNKVKEIFPNIKNVPDNNELTYTNNKQTELSLFSERNKFSGINLPNEYGVTFSYNMELSLASYAQFHRHRTTNFEIEVPKLSEEKFYIPLLLDGKEELIKEWLKDIKSVNKYYPQGKIIRANANGSLKRLVQYVGKERACDRAFLETEDLFTNEMLPGIYEGLLASGKIELAETLKPYVGKLRCMYPDYKCPGVCGHPRIRRKF